jgi:hypothetical protein
MNMTGTSDVIVRCAERNDPEKKMNEVRMRMFMEIIKTEKTQEQI